MSDDPALLAEIGHHKRLAPLIADRTPEGALVIEQADRGRIKQALLQFGYPAEDLAGYVDGAPLHLAFASRRRRLRVSPSRCATISATPLLSFTPGERRVAAAASSCCRAAPERRWWGSAS